VWSETVYALAGMKERQGSGKGEQGGLGERTSSLFECISREGEGAK